VAIIQSQDNRLTCADRVAGPALSDNGPSYVSVELAAGSTPQTVQSLLALISQLRRNEMAEMSLFNSIGIATIGVLCLLQAQPAASQEKRGVIPHAPLLKSVLPDTANQEVAVYETEYTPGGINPRHLHPAAITFYVLSGAGVWQEEGKPPVTLKAGDSLFVPAGTIHSHWNPSTTDRLRFLEFIVAEKDKGRSIPQPLKD
jgi:quercetin dioxygenase-like cupin family protein